MEFTDVIKKRYSVRSYRSDPVPDEVLSQVLEAAVVAPTAANRQPFRILVIHTEDRELELRQIYPSKWFTQAPLLVCVCGITKNAWKRSDGKNYADIDAAIVMDHIILAATNAGLGTCWVAAFDVEAARRILNIPDEWEPIAFTPLGYAEGYARDKTRRPLSDLVVHDRKPR
ncbi:nitroreductase family protein [Dehalogenimonas etheniformans]|uniref:Nitroreductase n=1 Tax=Dehalogenimonas etheniformans TaxID=1536648 RepID=A0A2P5P9A6_9CHLR|nr:nitroreductase family protein [Dehalogenimonas etheniformans]PPD58882.1 nitroreductase [Dehalogenimonas etheniformans]QNT76350.1 nitroreductase family protein [Dehalogenimonas etheniformans]